jgi:hypothetical protein
MFAAMRRASSGVNTFACRRRVCVQICTDSVAPRAKSPCIATTQFTTELKACDFRMVRNRIVSEDCLGITWKPVMTGGQIDRARTLRKVVRERRDEIVRRVRIGTA